MTPGPADYLRLVKFSHSIFALPFALQSAWLAAGGVPPLRSLVWIVVCAVAARTAAMGFNRWLDADLDRANPRTAQRELPTGELASGAVLLMVLIASAVFVAAAFQLGALCGWLSLPVLGVLLGYSYTKRFTWLCHAVLGLCLALAPLGAWVAIRGHLDGDLTVPLLLAAAVLTWVAGFDLIYACQDRDCDLVAGLRSVPARFGIPLALCASRLLHAITVLLLVALAFRAGLSWIFLTAVGLVAGLLFWEHRLVTPRDLSRVNMAFFTLNGWVAVGLFIGLTLDLALLGGH